MFRLLQVGLDLPKSEDWTASGGVIDLRILVPSIISGALLTKSELGSWLVIITIA